MRPSERLTGLFLLGLAVAALAGARRVDLASLFLATAAGLVALSRAPPSGAAAWVRDFSPVAIVVIVYLSLEPVITGVNPRRWDAFFSAFDDRWLEGLVAAWRGLLGRPARLTDASYLVYVSYYFLPIAAALAARRGGADRFERAVFTLLLCFYGSYLGYFLFPTAGPRLLESEETRLGGGAISAAIRDFLRHAGRTQLDAFPSGHTAVSLVSAALGSRAAPRAASALVAWALAVVFTTVYVHVHYAVDILAGSLLAGAVLLSAGPLSRILGVGFRSPRR